jgi:hypothetical protein
MDPELAGAAQWGPDQIKNRGTALAKLLYEEVLRV